MERDIDFRTVPELLAITLSTYIPAGTKEPTYLLAARAALQAVTGARTEITRVKHGVSQFGVSKGQTAGAKVTVWGEQAYELMDKMVHLVFPKIKEWPGIPGSTGDESGNLSWGFEPDQFALFPEIQANYDAYPAKVSSLFTGTSGKKLGPAGCADRCLCLDDSRMPSQRPDHSQVQPTRSLAHAGSGSTI